MGAGSQSHGSVPCPEKNPDPSAPPHPSPRRRLGDDLPLRGGGVGGLDPLPRLRLRARLGRRRLQAKLPIMLHRNRTVALAVGAALLTAGLWAAACGGTKAHELDNYSAGKTLNVRAYADAVAVMHLDEAELTYVMDDVRFKPYAELRRHRIIQVLTEEGRQRFSHIYVPTNQKMQPRDIKAQIIKRSGARHDLDIDAVDVKRFDAKGKGIGLYNDPAAKAFSVPHLEVGDVVEFQYVSLIRDPRWVDPLVAGEDAFDLPIREARLSVVSVPGYDIDFRVTVRGVLKNVAPERVPATVVDPISGGSAKIDATRFIWSFKNLPPNFPEPRGATPLAAATQVHVLLRRFSRPDKPDKAFLGYSNWEDVAAWYRDLMGKTDTSGSALAPDAKDARTKKDKLKLIQKGCGNLTLVDTGLGPAALKPHPPGAVIGAKMGDSKDLAQACLSATRAANIDAFPVLVARRLHRAAVPDLPTPAAFDHVIIAVPGQGTYQYFDPAGLGVPTGRTLPWSQGVDGVVVRPDGTERVHTPEDTAEMNTRELNFKLVLTTDAMVEGNAVFKLTGQDAAFVRDVMRGGKSPEAMAAVAEWLCGGDMKLTWVDMQMAEADPDADGPLRLLITFSKSPYGGLPGKLAIRFSELIGKPFPFLWRDGRITPVDLGYRVKERVIASVAMPEGMGMSVAERARDVDEDHVFSSFDQRYVAADGALVLRRVRTVKEPVVLPDRYLDLKELYERLWANLDQSTPIVSGGERGKDYKGDAF